MPSERAQEADQLLHTVHLDGFGDKRPHELSGGMRQRVAIARAFAQEADILLMDEPFGALDAMTRDLLHAELERLWADRNLSVVFVTHNVREAARLADRVVLLSSRPGRVVSEFAVDIERPRRMDSPEVSCLAAEITDSCDRRCAAMPTPEIDATTSRPALDAELAGLDALELAQRRRRPLPRRLWSAAWPKLAAIGIGLAIWEAVVASGWRPEFVLPRPRRCGTRSRTRREGHALDRDRGPPCDAPRSASRWPWSSAWSWARWCRR